MKRLTTCRGFTLIELIMVLVLVGVLAVFAFPKFSSTALPERGFHDAVWSTISHARRTSVASRRFTCVTITAGTGSTANVAIGRVLTDPDTFTSSTTIDCTTATAVAVPAPSSSCSATNMVCAPSNVTLGTNVATLVFDPLGRLVTTGSPKVVSGTTPAITVSNQSNITVQPETGYVQ
jgi:MSHA pilin protein MshC